MLLPQRVPYFPRGGWRGHSYFLKTDTFGHRDGSWIHFYEEDLVVTRIMSIFALYNVNKHYMPRQKREKSGTGICHVMQGKESKVLILRAIIYQSNPKGHADGPVID